MSELRSFKQSRPDREPSAMKPLVTETTPAPLARHLKLILTHIKSFKPLFAFVCVCLLLSNSSVKS